VLASEQDAHARLVNSIVKINKNRKRMSLSFKSSDEMDEEMSVHGKKLDRALFYEEYRTELKSIVNVRSVREKKLREREMVMCLLEKHEMIVRKRNGLEIGR
jgi:hypothetical protein